MTTLNFINPMRTNSKFKNLLKISFLTGFIPLVFNSQPTKALTACPTSDSVTSLTSVSPRCFTTPETLKVTFYEIGFCTSDPLSTGSLVKTNCSKSWDNSSGVTVDLGLKSFSKMQGNTYRVPNGTYTHAYAIMNDQWIIKGKYKLKDGATFYSKANYSGSTNESEYATFTDDIVNMEGNEGTNNCYDYSNTTDYGPVTAVLADNNLTSANSTSTCNSATRVIGSLAMNTSVTMDDTVKGYRLTWVVTNMGMGINIDGSGNPSSTLGGPFVPQFELIK